jgi:hypothetical protein
MMEKEYASYACLQLPVSSVTHYISSASVERANYETQSVSGRI